MLRLLPVLLLTAPFLPLASVAQAQAGEPAPPLFFAAGTVLAGGHELAADVTLPPEAGPVVLPVRDGTPLRWRVTVENGETQLLAENGRWVAKAEIHRSEKRGRMVCLIYQTTISPEWAVRGGGRPQDQAQGRADFQPADDRVYAFREIPCP
ncbi:MAG: hypothetical protein ACK4GK_17330 [Ferrovibrio sp.]